MILFWKKIGPDFERRSVVIHIIFRSNLVDGATSKFDINFKSNCIPTFSNVYDFNTSWLKFAEKLPFSERI